MKKTKQNKKMKKSDNECNTCKNDYNVCVYWCLLYYEYIIIFIPKEESQWSIIPKTRKLYMYLYLHHSIIHMYVFVLKIVTIIIHLYTKHPKKHVFLYVYLFTKISS